MVAGSTAALCAAAAAAGLYLTGHISGRDSGNVDTNSAQHLSSPAATPTHQASQAPSSTLTPTPSLTARRLGRGAESERQPEADQVR